MTMLPEGTEEGGILCTLYGSQTPHILRASVNPSEDTYAIIGPAYVHGFMDGEVFTGTFKDNLKSNSFVFV